MVIDDLNAIAETERSTRKQTIIRCCMAAGCMSSQSDALKKSLEQSVKDAGLAERVEVRGVGCMKLCCRGPLVSVDTQNALYQEVAPEDAPELVNTLKGGQTKLKRGDLDHPFFKKQLAIVLANSGEIDPERIEGYIAADGYQALHQVLREMTPKEVVETMVKSGLRGRGGAGFPTGLKWGTVAKTQSQQKYVICNADEGDPGAFMDRSVLESDPHSVLEGMAIAAYAVGANQGFIYVRAEYPLAIKRLQTAIKQAKTLGLLGSGIFESPFNFNMDIRIGAGRVRLRRGNRADGVGRRQARHAPAPSAVPGGKRIVGLPHAHQQRGDVRQRAADYPQRRGVVRRHRHRKEQGHQGFCARRQNQKHRPHRSADGHAHAADRRGNGRRRARRRQNQGRPDRRALRRLHSGVTRSTRRWITNRLPSSAPSWVRAA